ncbi:MAG: tetratricopeptide repeat protein [Deltaproteobacteria bacterium]|nr:tetratricopeptide repeat protein [Deltaproteobacteria bacterium]
MTKTTPSEVQDEAELQRRVAAGSQDPEDYRNLADLLLATGRYEEAVALYRRVLNLPLRNFPKARVSMELGWIFCEMGQQAEALPLAQTAIGLLSREPETPGVLACRGASQSLLAHCISITDANAGAEAAALALKWLGQAMVEDADFEGKAIAYVDAGRLYNLLGNTQEAIRLCEKCLQQELKDVERLSCLIVYGEALRREERFTEAEQVIEEAFQYVKGYKGMLPGLYLDLGLIQRFTNRLAEARETFQQALKARRANPYLCNDQHSCSEIYWNLGEVCYDLGDHREATTAFQKVLVYHPEDDYSHRNALLWLGECFKATGDHSKARGCFEEVLTSPAVSDAEKTSARKGLGEVFYESQEYREAAREFEEVVAYYHEDGPERCNALLWLGQCYFATRDNTKAGECYEGVLVSQHASDAEKASARKGLGKLYYEAGEYKEAAAAFEEVLAHCQADDPERCEILLWLGHCYLATGDHTKARECYEELLASPRTSESQKGSAQKSLGVLSYEVGKYQEAAAAFKAALVYQPKDDPDHWNTLLRLGYAYQCTDAYAKARDCYEEVLASTYASETDKVSARRSLVWCLANLYYESGKYEEAAAGFEEFLTSYPEDALYQRAALLWMGYSYQAMGANEQARDCFEKVLASPHASENEKASAREGLARLPQLPKKTLH